MGKVVEKLTSTGEYKIELMDLSDEAKEEIDEIMRSACNII
ncbi:hypothetical protein [Clostridium estertheticum]|nr:hypothetical protein [Clostridium estertheticum]